MVVPFSPGQPVALHGPFRDSELEHHLGHSIKPAQRPVAIRIDGRFEAVRVRSVPKQERPYPPLANVIAQQQVSDLVDASGTMVGFCFPDSLDGVEMVGWHLHFVTDDRARGGHVLSYTLLEATARVDDATWLHVELPAEVGAPTRAAGVDQALLRRLESDA